MTKMVGVTGAGEGGNFWASENLSWRVHFEGYSPKWRVLSKLSVQPCEPIMHWPILAKHESEAIEGRLLFAAANPKPFKLSKITYFVVLNNLITIKS